MSYVILNGQKFSEIDDAVRKAKEDKLKSAEIDIYDDDGDCVEIQTVTSEDDYEYYAYAVFRALDVELEEWDWYGNTEVCYNSEYEARDVVNAAAPGTYRITKVTQTVSEYGEGTDIDTIVVE